MTACWLKVVPHCFLTMQLIYTWTSFKWEVAYINTNHIHTHCGSIIWHKLAIYAHSIKDLTAAETCNAWMQWNNSIYGWHECGNVDQQSRACAMKRHHVAMWLPLVVEGRGPRLLVTTSHNQSINQDILWEETQPNGFLWGYISTSALTSRWKDGWVEGVLNWKWGN